MLETRYNVTFPDVPFYLLLSWHKGNVKGHSIEKQWGFFLSLMYMLECNAFVYETL